MQDEPFQLQLQNLQQIVGLLQLKVQHLQKDTVINKNQWEYCSSQLSKLNILTDEESLEEHQKYSCGNHYDG